MQNRVVGCSPSIPICWGHSEGTVADWDFVWQFIMVLMQHVVFLGQHLGWKMRFFFFVDGFHVKMV